MKTFKKKLDNYLRTIPDEPQIPGYQAQTSLLDMTQFGMANRGWKCQVDRTHLAVEVVLPALP